MPIKFTKDHFKWSNGRGHTQRPILYSQKKNNYGLGKKEHSSDQWWERAFDNQLKGLDVSTGSKGVTVKQSVPVSTEGMERVARYYIRFVRGGVLEGEVEKMVVEDVSTASEEGEKVKEGKEERRKRRAAKEERREKRRLKRLVERELEVLKGGR